MTIAEQEQLERNSTMLVHLLWKDMSPPPKKKKG